MESIITAIIAGGLALIVSSGQKKTEQRLQTAQAVTDCKIDELWFSKSKIGIKRAGSNSGFHNYEE